MNELNRLQQAWSRIDMEAFNRRIEDRLRWEARCRCVDCERLRNHAARSLDGQHPATADIGRKGV